MIKIDQQENDNTEFILNIEIIIKDRIERWIPKELYLTGIDNWFDDKWVKFSGTTLHEISIWKGQEVTIPPFHPNRVENSDYYQHKNSEYKKQKLENQLHIIQTSSDNLKRKITYFTNDGLFIWYSGNSKTNKKGTLMGYYVKDSDCFTFYISLTAEKDWNVHKINGMSTIEVKNIFERAKIGNNKNEH